MGSDDRQEIIDRALKALAAPELRDTKASRSIEEFLVEARKGGAVKLERLQQGVEALVVETGASKYLDRSARTSGDAQKTSGDTDSDEFSSLFGLFFLLILLLLLASRINSDSDVAALLNDLIQQLLDLLKGGS